MEFFQSYENLIIIINERSFSKNRRNLDIWDRNLHQQFRLIAQ